MRSVFVLLVVILCYLCFVNANPFTSYHIGKNAAVLVQDIYGQCLASVETLKPEDFDGAKFCEFVNHIFDDNEVFLNYTAVYKQAPGIITQAFEDFFKWYDALEEEVSKEEMGKYFAFLIYKWGEFLRQQDLL